MKIIIENTMMKGELEIGIEANIHDTMDAITAILMAEGYNPATIIDGYNLQLELLNQGIEEWYAKYISRMQIGRAHVHG